MLRRKIPRDKIFKTNRVKTPSETEKAIRNEAALVPGQESGKLPKFNRQGRAGFQLEYSAFQTDALDRSTTPAWVRKKEALLEI